MPLPADPVWFITGCSTGFGRDLARLVIDRGWRAVVTARDAARVADLVEGAEDRVLALALDVTDQAQIDAAAKAALDRFGQVDVLVNNAGYGYQSSIEEGEDAEIRAQFEANVFGLFAMTRALLPAMREAGQGAIVNFTSVAGLIGFASSGYYAASKHAVEGWSDALLAEVEPLGLSVTCVEPGPFRTDWAGRSLKQTPSAIPAYAMTARARMEGTKGYSGTQPGDPVRAGEAIIAAVQRDHPPRHLALGRFAYAMITARLKERLAEVEALREVSLGADYADGS